MPENRLALRGPNWRRMSGATTNGNGRNPYGFIEDDDVQSVDGASTFESGSSIMTTGTGSARDVFIERSRIFVGTSKVLMSQAKRTLTWCG
jgi:hypothetical protein